MASVFGNALKVSIFGQSHSPAVGVVIDGLPAGFKPDFEALKRFMLRRAPGRSRHATARSEADEPEILSGIVNGATCGAPLAAVIRNTDARPRDYEGIRDIPRPSHADFAAQAKFHGAQDVSGGGHFSGRLTAPCALPAACACSCSRRRGLSSARTSRQSGMHPTARLIPSARKRRRSAASRRATFPSSTARAARKCSPSSTKRAKPATLWAA